ncbi:MAG: hypothetical protein LBU87_02785 [Lactobacillales bacterium]|jgi:hypothetical protein|nr:hypothetical protein [Lactobacillales bacterium]
MPHTNSETDKINAFSQEIEQREKEKRSYHGQLVQALAMADPKQFFIVCLLTNEFVNFHLNTVMRYLHETTYHKFMRSNVGKTPRGYTSARRITLKKDLHGILRTVERGIKGLSWDKLNWHEAMAFLDEETKSDLKLREQILLIPLPKGGRLADKMPADYSKSIQKPLQILASRHDRFFMPDIIERAKAYRRNYRTSGLGYVRKIRD